MHISAILNADNFNIDNFETSNPSVVKILNNDELKAVSTGVSTLTYTFTQGDKEKEIYCYVEVNTTYSTYSDVLGDKSTTIYLTLDFGEYKVTVESASAAIPKFPEVQKEGYFFDGWYKDAELTQKVGERDRFSKNTTFYPKWITSEEKDKKEFFPSSVYSDIDTHWGRVAIEAVSYMGLFKGINDTEFGPDLPMTRAMAITVVGRLAKAEVEDMKSDAKDVTDGAYYDGFLAWAVENEIVELENGNFRPNDNITREEMAMIIANYMKFRDVDYLTDEINFSDKDYISKDALEAVKILNASGIMKGNADGTYSPKASCTRAQIAQIMYNYDNFIHRVK